MPIMPSQLKVIRVFAASPGDVADERRRLAKVVGGLNERLAEHLGVQLELKEWRQVAPGMGRPEDVILDQLPVETWDVFIGVLWLRFGMPPGRNRAGVDHDSGTEEEFRLACRAWEETRRPRILFYRCTRPAQVDVDAKQLAKVQKFFKQFAPDGENPGLFQHFGEADQFEKMVEKHLTGLLIEEYQASALPPRMREVANDARSSRGNEAPSSNSALNQSLLTSAATRRGKDGDGWRNPFIVGVPITDPADFFGREREINFCLARLRGMQSVSITGERRIGKSSLLYYLTATTRERLGPEFRPAYVDLLSPVARTLPGLLGEILRQLGVKRPAAKLTEFEQRLNALHDQGLKPLVALDELEMFIRLSPSFMRAGFATVGGVIGNLHPRGETTQDFCEALRALASDHRLVLLTASRITLRELHDHGAMVSPLYNIMGSQKLGLFTEQEAREFVTLWRSGVRFSEEQVGEILLRGGRHPLRLQSLCSHAAQANHEQRTDWSGIWTEAEAEAAAMLEPPPVSAQKGKA
jgi:hypothetical protein